MTLAALVLTAGCGDDPDPPDRAPEARAPEIDPVRCAASAGNCRSATGTIVYVEAVDPDGDGDAHFVLAGRDGVTAPGVSVIDVARELRPKPLPEPGDLLSAAGPVFPGSYGQRQIQATAIRAVRR